MTLLLRFNDEDAGPADSSGLNFDLAVFLVKVVSGIMLANSLVSSPGQLRLPLEILSCSLLLLLEIGDTPWISYLPVGLSALCFPISN